MHAFVKQIDIAIANFEIINKNIKISPRYHKKH